MQRWSNLGKHKGTILLMVANSNFISNVAIIGGGGIDTEHLYVEE